MAAWQLLLSLLPGLAVAFFTGAPTPKVCQTLAPGHGFDAQVYSIGKGQRVFFYIPYNVEQAPEDIRYTIKTKSDTFHDGVALEGKCAIMRDAMGEGSSVNDRLSKECYSAKPLVLFITRCLNVPPAYLLTCFWVALIFVCP